MLDKFLTSWISYEQNVHTHWNPDTAENSWDKEADDGTAKWMSDNAGLDFSSKDYLFKNMVYTIRRTEEALAAGGVPFKWAGIIWVQGNADKEEGFPDVWKAFGENTVRVWEGFREVLGDDVPIIDNGSSTKNQLKSGKEYATQIVKGCKAKSIEWALASDDDTSTECIPGATNVCLDAPNRHLNHAFFDFYGYDTKFPEEYKPDGATDKTFYWYVNFPINQHSAYEGMVLKGRTFANHFILEFTDCDLPSNYADVDPAIQFPLPRCDDGTLPSDDNFCWIDYRDESQMMESCTVAEDDNVKIAFCEASNNDDDDDDDDSSASSPKNAFLSISFLLLLAMRPL